MNDKLSQGTILTIVCSILLIVVIALIFNIVSVVYASVKSSEIELKQAKISQTYGSMQNHENNEVNTEQSEQIDINKELAYSKDEKKQYILESHGLLFEYPSSYTVFEDENLVYIFPSKIKDTPIPAMKISIIKKGQRETLQGYIRRNFVNVEKTLDVTINELQGKEVIFYQATDPYQTCGHTVFENENMFYDFSLYECIEWTYFTDVLNSFKKII